jgi:polyphosphate kinase
MIRAKLRRGREMQAKFILSTAELLDRLVDTPLLLDHHPGAVSRSRFRAVYHDTADGLLERRGVSCRLRTRADGTVVLGVRIAGAGEQEEIVEASVPQGDVRSALRASSEPVERLTSLVDPSALKPQLVLSVDRRTRKAGKRRLFGQRLELSFDLGSVTNRGLNYDFYELKLRADRSGQRELKDLGRALQMEYGLRRTTASKLDRARRILAVSAGESTPEELEGGSQVAVLALRNGCCALRSEAGRLGLPVQEGGGPDKCRELLQSFLPSSEGELSRVGSSRAEVGSPALELWLARLDDSAAGSLPRCEDPGVEWMAFDELIARLGSPGLRHPQLLEAASLLSRSSLFRELLPDGGKASHRRSFRPAPETLTLDSFGPGHYLNEDLSQLEFNSRVLELAEDPQVPLLERFRFLSIAASNMDELFMVRMGGLKHGITREKRRPGRDGLTRRDRVEAIAARSRQLSLWSQRCLAEDLLPELARSGTRILSWRDLTDQQQRELCEYFDQQVFPLLTPQAMTISPGHPFPRISNLELSLAAVVREPRRRAMHFARIRVPDDLALFVPVPGTPHRVPLEEVISANLSALYPRQEVDRAYAFRVTRSGQVQLAEKEAVDLVDAVKKAVSTRPHKQAVRVEVDRSMPRKLREMLLRELGRQKVDGASSLSAADLYEVVGPLDLDHFEEIADLALPELCYPPFEGASPFAPDRSMFEQMAQRDLLVHHPYESFEATVERFFAEAADDPDVAVIRLTLYRSGTHSTIVESLLRAAAQGKDVSVFVELKARFDEERNIEWADTLQQGGIHVVHGYVGFKTHCKTALVVRREQGVVRRYVHIGTGNYNDVTARLYTDLGLFSADPELGADVNDLFNELTGRSSAPAGAYRRLLVAPATMLSRVVELIDREAERGRAGEGGRIRAKLNGLADPKVIRALYRASEAGVEIDLVVRGICRLRPGTPGISSRIRVTSILGRFLEHARVFAFGQPGRTEYFIGSADWRPRNLRRRVEVLTPVLDPTCCSRLEEILNLELSDPTAWELGPCGSYRRRQTPAPGRRPAQRELLDRAWARARAGH